MEKIPFSCGYADVTPGLHCVYSAYVYAYVTM